MDPKVFSGIFFSEKECPDTLIRVQSALTRLIIDNKVKSLWRD